MSTYEVQTVRSVDGFDDREWDLFVDASPQGSIMCYSWWLEAVCPRGFEILLVRKGGRIVAGMPMVRFRRVGYETMGMAELTPRLGVLLAPATGQKYETELSGEMTVLRELVEAIPHVDYFWMNFHHTFANWLPFHWAGYEQTTRYTYIVGSASDVDTLFGDMSKNTRTVIRKAQKCGIVVREEGDLDTVLELNTKTFGRQGMRGPYTDEIVRRLDIACAVRNVRRMLVARDPNGRAASALYVVLHKRYAYAVIPGTDPDFRASGANSLVYWAAMELAQGLGLSLDFQGSMMENVERLLRGLGARQVPYFFISKDRRSLLAKMYLGLRSRVGRLILAAGIRR